MTTGRDSGAALEVDGDPPGPTSLEKAFHPQQLDGGDFTPATAATLNGLIFDAVVIVADDSAGAATVFVFLPVVDWPADCKAPAVVSRSPECMLLRERDSAIWCTADGI